MRWLMASDKHKDQHYAEEVLKTLVYNKIIVPNLWHLEVSNILYSGQKQQQITPAQSTIFLAHLESLPITVDELTSHQAFSRILDLTQIYQLTSYNAAYLELAIRRGAPLATLDKNLAKAAEQAGVKHYLCDR
jgi:predicted nucleic acid-binding protein